MYIYICIYIYVYIYMYIYICIYICNVCWTCCISHIFVGINMSHEGIFFHVGFAEPESDPSGTRNSMQKIRKNPLYELASGNLTLDEW